MFIEYHDSNWNVILTTLKVYMKVFFEVIQVYLYKIQEWFRAGLSDFVEHHCYV